MPNQDLNRNIGRIDRAQFRTAHNDSVYTQTLFAQLQVPDIFAHALAYPPCWAVIDPGMTVEAHQHPIPEFYVFVNGAGTMRLGDQRFPVESGMAVNIPPNIEHEVINDASAVEPLIWVSIGLKETRD